MLPEHSPGFLFIRKYNTLSQLLDIKVIKVHGALLEPPHTDSFCGIQLSIFFNLVIKFSIDVIQSFFLAINSPISGYRPFFLTHQLHS